MGTDIGMEHGHDCVNKSSNAVHNFVNNHTPFWVRLKKRRKTVSSGRVLSLRGVGEVISV